MFEGIAADAFWWFNFISVSARTNLNFTCVSLKFIIVKALFTHAAHYLRHHITSFYLLVFSWQQLIFAADGFFLNVK